MTHPPTLAAQATGPDRLIGGLLVLAALLLVFGWILPIMTVNQLFFLTERVSILQGVVDLWRHGDYFLVAIIFLFSVLVPLAKLAIALFLWYRVAAGSQALQRGITGLERLGRWSMLDVFVVALLVVAIQGSLISDVQIHAGIYVFSAAVLLSIATVQRMGVLARRAVREAGS